MIEFEQIQDILGNAIDVIKKSIEYKNGEWEFKTTPNFSENYVKASEYYEKVSVHSQGLDFPELLFKSKAPNEDDLMHEYRESIYQPITKPDWRRGVNNYNRVFNPQNYAIDGWQNDKNEFENESAEDYFMNNYPKNDSIISYFRSIVKNKKLEDPNAVIALWIENIEAPDTELRQTIGKIFDTEKVVYFEKDYCFILSDEKSIVKYYDKQKEIGFVFYLYDDNTIYRIYQAGSFTDWAFEFEVYYNHGLGYIPVSRLVGVEVDEGLYQSHAYDAIPPLNDVLFDNSTLQASKIAHAYPQKWEFTDDCPNINCDNGWISSYGEDEKEYRSKCSTCGGTGKFNSNPLGVHEIKRLTGLEEGGQTPIPPLGFVSMDTTILQFLRDEISLNTSKSFSFLGVDISMTNAKGSDSALGKIIDREDLFSALLDFSSEIWDLIEFTIDFCGKVRYGVNTFQMPSIKKPTNFAIRNESDLTEEYNNAANLPDAIKATMLTQYTNVRFGSDEQLQTILELKQLIDRLFLMNNETVSSYKTLGAVQIWEIILHTSFDTFMDQKIKDNAKYLETDWKIIKSEMVKMAKDAAPVAIGSTQDILNT